MAQQNPTIIVGHLDSSDLTESIDKLVKEVAEKTSGMANDFTQAIDKMKFAMKDFAITQKVSVDLMKEAWRDMSKSFDAMVAAQSASTGGGKGSGKAHAPNTIGALEQEIAEIKQERKELELNSDELRIQNGLLERRKNLYKEQTTSLATKRVDSAMSLSTNKLDEAEKKLRLLEILQRRYAGTTELSVSQQNRLARAIQKTKEQIDKLKPKSLNDVLSMDESSFDAIAKKMAALKNVSWGNPQEQKKVTDEYQRLRQEQNKLLSSNARLSRSNNYLAQSFGYIRNRIVYALTLGAITNFIKQLYEIRGQYELLERSLGVLVGSFEKGTQIFNELNEMAIKSPFTLIELGTAAKQLTAYNFAANEVVDTTRRLADISAALGVPMERLTYNLGQIKAQGVLNARDARDFANAGLAIVPMLAKMYTEQKTFGDEMVTTAKVYDMMSKKMVTYSDVLKVLYQVTDEGGKFFDFQAKQADTLRVQMANLTLAYNNMLNEIGSENQGILVGMVSGLKTLLKNWRDVSRIVLTLITTFGTYRAIASIVTALNSRMFVGRVIVSIMQYIKGIKAATGAMATFNAVTKMNPIGLLVSALAAAVGYFVLFDNSVSEASEIVEQFGENGAKSLKKIDTLQKVLNGTSKTSSVYKKTLEELSTITSEYGVHLDKENAKRSDINKAIEQTIQLIKEESSERQRANQLEKARSTYEGETEAARKELQETIAKSSNISGGGVDSSYLKAIKENSEAVAAIVDEVVTNNIHLIVNKSGEELEKGINDLYGIINTRLKKVGIAGGDIQQILSGLLSSTSAVEKFAISIANANEKLERRGKIIERNKQIADEATQATMTFTQKVDANARALRNNTSDALSLYNQIYDIVKIAKENHTITFDLELVAQQPPKWMLNKSLPELQQLAERFTAIAKSGGHVNGYNRETTYQQGLLYASAARQKQEEEERKERMKDTKNRTNQSDKIAQALKDEISLVKELQGAYDTLTKKGDSHANAIAKVQDLYGKTIDLLNKDMAKFGLPQLDLSIIKGNNHNEVLAFFEKVRDVLESKGLSNLKRMEAVEGVVKEFKLKAETYNLDMITKGLNSELDKLKDEYELAIALDADPELGSMFADWMGFDMDDLPRTAQEYANRATNALNKALKERDADLELPNLLNITDDDLRELQNRVGTGGITQTYVDEITKAVKDVRGVFKKEKEDTSKEWNALIEKYGGLQAKLLKIYKDTVQQQSSIVKQFGSDEQISQALDLVRKIQISQDPADIARLQEQLAKIINDITSNNPIALKTYQATQNEQNREESKAYWENFKESDLYAMTFEDVANLSNRAIDMMIEKLDELKDKVKESPESMKALIKAKNDLEEAKNVRDPFGGMIRSLKASAAASKEAKTARDQLAQADIRLKNAEENLENAKASKDITAIAKAEQEVAKAKEKRETAQKNLTNAENKGKKAQNNFVQSAQALSQNMQTMGEIANQTAELFRMFGENDTADVIAEIGSAFMSLIPTIVAVGVAIKTLEATSVILLAISAAISAVIGLVSFFSGNSNKKITEKVEESERAVKRLENSYKKLEYAAEQAFGAATSGAQQALKANKELQLFELRRQLALEESRSGKHYDEDKILDLKGQIIDLENEIKDFTKGAVNDLLGISSHGNFFEDMISEMIDAFKNGEDAMKVFEEKWSKMIDNMIMKTIVSQVLQNWINSLEKGADDILEKYTKEQSDAIANLNNSITDFSLMDAGDASKWIYENDRKAYIDILKQLNAEGMRENGYAISKKIQDMYIANMQSQLDDLNAQLDKASLDATGELIDYYGRAGEDFKANYLDVILDKIKENWNFGQDNENKLSQLQQGIQGITENQAGALEAYWNANTQQQYVQSDLLREIRDILAGGDADIQTGVQAQILLQLQQSYAVQMAIQEILNGVLTPSGQGFRVELVS